MTPEYVAVLEAAGFTLLNRNPDTGVMNYNRRFHFVVLSPSGGWQTFLFHEPIADGYSAGSLAGFLDSLSVITE